MSDLVALRAGTMLVDDYRIERVLGAGGFGITYLAEEVPLARLVTIKEYFPVDFAARDHAEDVVPRSQSSEGDYSWGLDRFLAEAQTLARFNHPNIVRVYRFFQARNTGYIVLHYEEGQSLKSWLKSLGRAPRQHELDKIVTPLLDALETVHSADYLHRDIAPDNIMIRRDGQPVLIDFGSARGDIAKHSKTISALVKPGYSPYEQYATTSRQQGPWTDIYSLGATLYEAVTNRRPPDAPSRMVADEMIPPADAALSSYRPGFLSAIARSLRLEISERPRSVGDWRAELMTPPRQPAPPPEAKSQPEPGPEKELELAVAAPAVDRGKSLSTPVAPAPAARGSARPGLAGAFLAGWRKGVPQNLDPVLERPQANPQPVAKGKSKPKVKAREEPALPGKQSPAPAPTAAVSTPAAAPARSLFRRRRTAVALPPPPPEPGARQATPRALRKRGGSRWRGLLAKLILGIIVAGAIVALQNRLPTVRREGAGVLMSQTGVEVPLTRIRAHKSGVTGVGFTPDGHTLVSASADGTLKVWDAAQGSLLRTFELDGGAATALAITEGRAATGHKDGTIVVFDLATGAKAASFKRSDSPVLGLVFVGSPNHLAASGQDGKVALWDIALPATPIQVFEGHEGPARVVAYARRGPFVASGSADQHVKLWHLEQHELIRTYRGHDDGVLAVAFDPGGNVLASSDQGGQIRLWSTYANRLKRRLRGHEGAVPSLAFTPDGDHLVSGGADATVRIWKVSNGRLRRTLKAGSGPVTAVSVSADGKRIAAAYADGAVRIFDGTVPGSGS